MKNFVSTVAVLAALVLVAQAGATEPGKCISKKGLSKMGIPGLKGMSDAEGTKVRGTFAAVGGGGATSVSLFGSGAAGNSAFAASGNFFATGSHSSAAGVTVSGPGFSFSASASAGGTATAIGF